MVYSKNPDRSFKSIPTKNKIFLAIVVFVLISILYKFIINPSIVGYAIYQDTQKLNQSLEDYSTSVGELRTEVLKSDVKAESYTEFNKQLREDLERYTEDYLECQNKLSKSIVQAESENTVCLTRATDLEKQLEQKQREIETIKEDRKDDLDLLVGEKNNEIDNIRDQMDELKDGIGEKNTLIQTLETKIVELQEEVNDISNQTNADYDKLASNAANNICCKKKVDNPSIRYYSVSNHKIECFESGEQLLIC